MTGQNTGLVRERWTSLDELLEAAVDSGFTQDQFACAIETVGRDPQRVANELQRHVVMASMRDKSRGA
jgi:hypothetical protein